MKCLGGDLLHVILSISATSLMLLFFYFIIANNNVRYVPVSVADKVHSFSAWAHYSKSTASYTFTVTTAGYYMANCFQDVHNDKWDDGHSATISTTGTMLSYLQCDHPNSSSGYTKAYSTACALMYCNVGNTITCSTGGENVYHSCGINIALMT